MIILRFTAYAMYVGENIMETNQPKSLVRFLDAQKGVYEKALNEIRKGRKTSHWIWFIFPQIKGLGTSPMAEYYGIENLDEAKAYLSNDILRERLLEISEVLLNLKENDPAVIFGYPDNLKLKSSMTLFALADPNCHIFQSALDKFYDGKQDTATLKIVLG